MWRDMMLPQLLIQLPLCLLIIVLQSFLKVEVALADAPIARPGCKDTCGNVSIPFPFGIGPNCYLDQWFEIECKASSNSNGFTKPFLSKFHIEVMEVTFPTNYLDFDPQKVIVRIPPLNVCRADTHPQQLSSIDLRGSPYNFSMQHNVFLLEGCRGSAVLVNQSKTTVTGCSTVCHNNNSVISTKKCYGVRCCQTPLPSYDLYEGWLKSSYISPLQFYQMKFNLHSSGERKNCLVATLMKSDSVTQYGGKLSTLDPSFAAPVVLLWSWISDLHPDISPRARCWLEVTNNITTHCECIDNAFGNAYVLDGCQVPVNCKGCNGSCILNEGSSYQCVERHYPVFYWIFDIVTVVAVAIGPMLLVCGCCGLYRLIKKRRKTEQRVKFFKKKLQQQLSSSEGGLERAKIFTNRELEKATDHFNENRILGQGGQGTVYKGMLIDGRIVAIKKSKLLDESRMEQFINELVILSQINHRNVVKLLGCCLQTEVPLLVYEFVPNGTLATHIHDPSEEFFVNWAMRLKIASDSAGAIAYLHSSSASPIYHRDIKSSNILLDDKYQAKVSDFGSSRTIAIDQTHLTTLVQGTMGYLDPEYLQSNQFTEKSDVYSFGVVLLELLIGKKPIYRAETMEQKNLVTEFLFWIQNSRLSEILDPKIVKEAKEEELTAVVNLAKRCLSSRGELRPTMKEVAMTLEMIIKSPVHVTLNPEAYVKGGVGEPVIVETSDRDLRKPWSSMDLFADATSSFCVVELPLLSNTV